MTPITLCQITTIPVTKNNHLLFANNLLYIDAAERNIGRGIGYLNFIWFNFLNKIDL